MEIFSKYSSILLCYLEKKIYKLKNRKNQKMLKNVKKCKIIKKLSF